MTSSGGGRLPRIVRPPCTDARDALDLYRLLMLHVRELKLVGEPVNLHYFLLSQVMHQHRPKRGDIVCTSCPGPYPCPTVSALALMSRFPIPWAPVDLARALEPVTGLHLWVTTDEIVDASIGDEVDNFRRDEVGIWVLTRSGKSGTHITAIGDDDAMCERLADYARQWTVGISEADESALDILRPSLTATRTWWGEHSRYAYLAELRSHGTPPA